MDAPDDHEALEPRLPTGEDLAFLCRHLNEAGAKYIVIGGFAILQHGFARSTMDIDLLIDGSSKNIEKIKSALMHLPDGAAHEVRVEDFDECLVVRVADEVVVDLMIRACGISYAEAINETETTQAGGVSFLMPTLELLWKMKQTFRAKDEADRIFIRNKLAEREDAD
jgi:hypothetical protein